MVFQPSDVIRWKFSEFLGHVQKTGGTVGLCLMGRVGKISWCRSKTSNGFETTRYCILLDILHVGIDLIFRYAK